MADQLISWDYSLLLLLNGSESLFIDGFFWTVTRTLTWLPVFLCLLYIIVKNNEARQAFTLLLIVALLILLTDQFASSVCKPYFHRLRPTHNPNLYPLLDLVNGYRGGLYSFISSHAANTFGAAIFFSLLFRHTPITIWLFFWASLSSYSRIYLGVHYPADIAAGALAGIVFGLLAFMLFRYVCSLDGSKRNFYSSAYTSNGYQIADLHLLSAAFACNMVLVMLGSVVYASIL